MNNEVDDSEQTAVQKTHELSSESENKELQTFGEAEKAVHITNVDNTDESKKELIPFKNKIDIFREKIKGRFDTQKSLCDKIYEYLRADLDDENQKNDAYQNYCKNFNKRWKDIYNHKGKPFEYMMELYYLFKVINISPCVLFGERNDDQLFEQIRESENQVESLNAKIKSLNAEIETLNDDKKRKVDTERINKEIATYLLILGTADWIFYNSKVNAFWIFSAFSTLWLSSYRTFDDIKIGQDKKYFYCLDVILDFFIEKENQGASIGMNFDINGNLSRMLILAFQLTALHELFKIYKRGTLAKEKMENKDKVNQTDKSDNSNKSKDVPSGEFSKWKLEYENENISKSMPKTIKSITEVCSQIYTKEVLFHINNACFYYLSNELDSLIEVSSVLFRKIQEGAKWQFNQDPFINLKNFLKRPLKNEFSFKLHVSSEMNDLVENILYKISILHNQINTANPCSETPMNSMANPCLGTPMNPMANPCLGTPMNPMANPCLGTPMNSMANPCSETPQNSMANTPEAQKSPESGENTILECSPEYEDTKGFVTDNNFGSEKFTNNDFDRNEENFLDGLI